MPASPAVAGQVQLRCPSCQLAGVAPPRCTGCGRVIGDLDGVPLLFPLAADGHRQRQRELYSHVAAEYDDAIPSHVAGHYLQRRLRLFTEWLTPGGTILDVGCGTGVLAASMEQRGFSLWGVDGSPEMLLRARERGIVVAAAPSVMLPFPDDQFDGAVTVATLHHVADRVAVHDTIVEMVRVVKPGGRVVLWDHNPRNPYWPIIMKRVPQDDGSERLVALDELLTAASDAQAVTPLVVRLGFMPDFLPEGLLPLARRAEAILEAVPGVRSVAAHNVVVLEKAG